MPDESCATCRFYRPTYYEDEGGKVAMSIVGFCHRRAPVSYNGSGHWPTSAPSDWCGEYAPKEATNATAQES